MPFSGAGAGSAYSERVNKARGIKPGGIESAWSVLDQPCGQPRRGGGIPTR